MEQNNLAKMIFVLIISVVLIQTTTAQNNEFKLSESMNEFAINFLTTTNNVANENLNLALSPFTVWTLLAIIAEGSQDTTATQLENALRIPSDKKIVRNSFKNLTIILQQSGAGVKLNYNSAIFVNKQHPVRKIFEEKAQQFYDVNLLPINFKNADDAVKHINHYIRQASLNRIPNFVNKEDISNAQIFLASILYFKGEWNLPFNRTATQPEDFMDEKGNKIGKVNMMFQTGVFPYARIPQLRLYAVELPYANGKTSMIILLPFPGDSVASMLNLLSTKSFSHILKTLDDAEMTFVDEEIHVYLPRFTIQSDLNLNVVLAKMGVVDVFDSQKADLLGMVNQYLFIKRIIQKAEIEVTEEGTIATAAAGAAYGYKSPPPRFNANKPFLYFIVDKIARTIIFAGKYSNPNQA